MVSLPSHGGAAPKTGESGDQSDGLDDDFGACPVVWLVAAGDAAGGLAGGLAGMGLNAMGEAAGMAAALALDGNAIPRAVVETLIEATRAGTAAEPINET